VIERAVRVEHDPLPRNLDFAAHAGPDTSRPPDLQSWSNGRPSVGGRVEPHAGG
jgi:hypothetical protein